MAHRLIITTRRVVERDAAGHPVRTLPEIFNLVHPDDFPPKHPGAVVFKDISYMLRNNPDYIDTVYNKVECA